jgi:hypothetical protein
MPKQREAPASKGGKGGQLTIAAKMAEKHKAASQAVKAVAAKIKGGKRARDSSDESGLGEESEGEVSSAESSLPDPDCSQLKAQRRTKPEKPIIEVTFHFSIFVHSHVLI